MNRFFRKTKGAISVFLVLVLLPVMLFGGLTTDAARIYFSKVTISDAGEMAMNAALANYNAELMDEFGFMAMDSDPASYATEVQEFFTKSLNGTGLGDEESYSHLLDLVAEEVNTIAVQGSQIYRTEVEKQQIIEYMKYRAPLCLVDLVLEKLDALKDTQKKVDAVEAEMDFSKSAKKSQDAMEAAYDAVDELNTNNQTFAAIYPGDGLVREGAQMVIDYAKVSCTTKNGNPGDKSGIAGAILKCYAISKYEGYQEDAELESAAESYISEAGNLDINDPLSDSEFNDYLDAMYYSNTVDKQGGIGVLVPNWLAANPEPTPAEEEIPLNEREPGSTETTRETEAHKQWAETKAEKEEIVTDYNNAKNNKVSKYPGKLKLATSDLMKAEINELGHLEAYARLTKESATTAVEKLEDLQKKIADSQAKWQTWSDKEGIAYPDTPDSEKNSDKYKDLYSEEEKQLLQNLLDDAKHLQTFYTEMEAAVRKVKFCGKDFWWYYQISDIYGAAYSRAGEILSDVTIDSNFTTNLSGYASQFEANFEHVTLSDTVDPWRSINEDPFYVTLKELNQKAQNSKNTTNASKAEANQKLTQGGNAATEATKEDDYPDFDWGSVENAATYLPSLVLNSGGGDAANSAMTNVTGGSVDEDKSENILQKYMDSIKAASTFLEGLDSILADTVEDLYVAEYAMQMCSYYTVDRTLEGTEKAADDIITISGYKLAARKPYKAEVEYIIWGNNSSKKNVSYTVMTLFGIRLLFNSIFAFTDTALRTSAQGIATAAFGWAPFLVPIAQVLIQLGYAAIETGNDIKLLKQGYGVAVIKSQDTWATTLHYKSNPELYTNKGVSLSYAEYLRIFMVLKMMVAGNKKTLARIGDCVQLASDYDLTKGYTMIAIDANVKSRTTFMRKISEMEGGAGTWSYSDGYYPIQYQSIMGY